MLRFKGTITMALLVLGLCCLYLPISLASSDGEKELESWLEKYNQEYQELLHNDMLAQWNYETDLTDENQKKAMDTKLRLAKFRREKVLESKKKFDSHKIENKILKRSLEVIGNIGLSISSDQKKLQKISSLTNSMLKTYSTACYEVDGQCKKLQPNGLQSIIAHSRDYEKLKVVWKGWRDVSGRKMRKDFAQWVQLSNEAIREGKQYKNLGESWRSSYGPGFVEKVEKLFEKIKPFYRLLHAYVRDKLIKKYGAQHFKNNLIPAHLLGNMWAQDWANIDDIVLPFKDRLDVTNEMKKQGYNVSTMFHHAEDFFTSIGLKNMTETFWQKSVFTKALNKEMVCHASAWDLMKPNDFRIKMCTEVTMEDFITIHHEMGHIQYYQQYEDQKVYFRNGANPGFHEAVGDTLALSVSTPEHLEKLNLSKNFYDSPGAEINYLMLIALDKLTFIPFAYLMDKFRWNVFSGKIPESKYTEKWWEYKCEYQGITPPVARTEEDFDPGCKMHIAGAVPYIRYFVSYVLQFQFHKALCQKIGQDKPLHKCDIYESKEAGQLFSNMLKLGSSVSWEEALKRVTGTKEMDAGPMLEYFDPLIKWLEKNTDKKKIGWSCGENNIGNSKSNANRFFDSVRFLCISAILFFFNIFFLNC